MKYYCMVSTIRRVQKITQEELAKTLGISRKTLSQIENGKELGLFLAIQISQILNTPLEVLWTPVKD